MIVRSLSIAALGLMLCAGHAQAAPILLGTQVTGSINFGANPINYYDSDNGFVPGGCLNSGTGSTTVTIADPNVEFCFNDGANIDRAQFTDTMITLTDEVLGAAGALDWTQMFTDAAFVGLTFVEIGDNFPNGGVNLVHAGNQLTFTWAGTGAPGNFAATYEVAAIPEPMTLALLGVGLGALGARARRKRVLPERGTEGRKVPGGWTQVA